uniref:TPR repeat n=1 Tax=Chlorobium chlorochromatii (strain CaD3) TaxID=340177 RepID=Q3ASX0_CHLCH
MVQSSNEGGGVSATAPYYTSYKQALAYVDEQRYEEALQLFDHCIAIERRHAALLYGRAVTLLALGTYRQACCDLFKSLALDKAQPEAWKHLAYLLFMLGKDEPAEKTLKKALERFPDYAPLYCVLADIYLDLGEFDKAHEAIEQALRLDPQNPEPHSKLAMYYVARGNMEGLQQECKTLEQLDAALAEQIRTLFFENQ